MARFFSDMQLDEMARRFDMQGYLRVENALTADQIRGFNQAVDRHIKDWPDDWMALSDSFCEAIDVLPHQMNEAARKGRGLARTGTR